MKRFKKNKNFNGNPKGLLIAIIVFVVSLFFISRLADYTRSVKTINYTSFMEKVYRNDVKSIEVSGQNVSGRFKDNSQFETIIPINANNWDVFREHEVNVKIDNQLTQNSLWYLLLLMAFLSIPLAIWFFFKQSRGSSSGGTNIFSIGKSKAKLFMPSSIKVNFNSVAGVVEAKEELKDFIDFLKNPNKYKKLGAKITRGVLLVGEPGNGKTLLAKAVAGEANCPFFSVSGSDFIEIYVGVGAARVRDLFAQAKRNTPSIIFIDEIDSIGRQRGNGSGGGHEEREQTLNQLLAEMDGFQTSDAPVIVLAATNRPDVLDKALLRPGRFDRRVYVSYPDLVSRNQILKLHAKDVKISPDINFEKIAKGTSGFSGADLANLINESAINASKRNQEQVGLEDIEEAIDKVILGKELKTIILTEEDKKRTAYHESGHALTGLLMPEDTDPLYKVTIIPRGISLGATHSIPERDKYNVCKEEVLAKIIVGLGGRAAEELVFNKLSSGAYSDFRYSTNLARNMVCNYGMTKELGMVVYSQQSGDFVYSQKTAEKIDSEVKNILDECYEKAKELLRANKNKLDILANALLEKETLYAGDIYKLLGIEPRQEFKIS